MGKVVRRVRKSGSQQRARKQAAQGKAAKEDVGVKPCRRLGFDNGTKEEGRWLESRRAIGR